MNQEEEVPTRVTRGALRRRSIDQDATPQSAAATGTAAAGGTPKKATSTTKKAPALGAIQENQGRPSTPVGGTRNARRRMSETIDTPTTAPNKLVQQLKDSEAVGGSGRHSRNSSLTEENVQELNAANEGSATTTRTRTPARLRASHETLTSTTPQTVPTAVRRSTRRNSVTSDDGASSVQSLPITTPKTPVLRSLKDETIMEEDTSDDRAESVTSQPRSTRRIASSVKSPSQSPRQEAASPQLTPRHEQTPPRVSNSPALKLPNSTPRSKNVSFTDDSKREDYQSAYPKTPTSPGRKFVLVGVNDLRHTALISGVPKVNAEVELSGSAEKVESARKKQDSLSPPVSAKGPNDSSTAEATKVVDRKGKDSPVTKSATKSQPTSVVTPSLDTSSIPAAERSVVVAVGSNDVSGIEALESSMVDASDTSAANVSHNQTAVDGSPANDKFSKYWSHSVRGTTTKAIDAFSVRRQEEKLAEDKSVELNASQASTGTLDKSRKEETIESHEEDEDHEAEEEEERNEASKNEFVDDEAMEVDGYQSGDSLDAEIRREMSQNEVLDQGEDIGSEDTEEDELDGEDEHDSFIVTDDEDELDEDALLAGSGDDLSVGTKSPAKKPEQEGRPRRRIVHIVDDSEEEEEKKRATSDLNSSALSPTSDVKVKRSARPLTTDEESSPEKKRNSSVSVADVQNTSEKVRATAQTQATPVGTPRDGKRTPVKPASGDATPSKVGNVSVQSAVRSSPLNKTEVALGNKSDSSSVSLLEASQRDVSKEGEAEEHGEQSTSTSKSLLESVTSRKSLPASSASGELESVRAAASRKSLPASTKMQFVEEHAPENVHPSSSNLEASYQEEEEAEEDQSMEQRAENNKVQPSAANGDVSVDDAKVSASNVTSDEEYYEATEGGEEGVKPCPDEADQLAYSDERPVVPVKPARKTLPVASLISAQFYLSGSKKEQRNTIATGDVAMGTTSTPNQKTPSAKKKNAAGPTTLVANPFALAAAKAKARLSMGAVAGVEPEGNQAEKRRKSLPVKLAGKESDPSDGAAVVAGHAAAPKQQLDEPEPMEVDEDDDEVEVLAGENDEEKKSVGSSPQEDVGKAVELPSKPKTPKIKTKSVRDFDLDSILSRCNEVVRADKERKKLNATLLQKKRDEKRRLRQLHEEQEKLHSADANGQKEERQRDTDDEDDTDADDGEGKQQPGREPANASTTGGASMSEQPTGASGQGEEPAKKKKKKKKKVKNYILEELVDVKKDRVAAALQHKLEALEKRKLRKKERREAKLLDKENGDTAAGGGGAAEGAGIGAKLRRVKKKKQRKTELAAAAAEEKDADEAETAAPKQPTVRVALSAFAVFQANGQTKPTKDVSHQKSPADKSRVESVVAEQPAPPKVKETPKKLVQKAEAQPKKVVSSEAAQQVNGHAKDPQLQPAAAKKHEKSPKEWQKTDKQSKENRQPEEATEPPIVAKTTMLSVVDDVVVTAGKKKPEGKKAAKIVATTLEADPVVEEEVATLGENQPPKAKKPKKSKADKMSASVEQQVEEQVVMVSPVAARPQTAGGDVAIPTPKQKKGSKKKGDDGFNAADDTTAAKKTKVGGKQKETTVADALREIRAIYNAAPVQKKKSKLQQKATHDEEEHDDVVAREVDAAPPVLKKKSKLQKAAAAVPEVEAFEEALSVTQPKKRKREPVDVNGSATSTTPRPTKLRALQRADHGGGFVEETVTPEKARLKRNFGFQELQATPKAVGFKVSSLLPTDELTTLARNAKGGAGKQRSAPTVVPEPSRSLPLPVWTSSGYFLEVPEEKKKKAAAAAAAAAGRGEQKKTSKGHNGFKLKTLRPATSSSSLSSSSAAGVAVVANPHRIDPDTVTREMVSFKRQQLIDRTAHLREKKKGGRV